MYYFVEFEILKYVHMLILHTIDTYSKFQWPSALSSEKDNSEIAHLLTMMVILEMLLQAEANDALEPVCSKVQFFNIMG